MNGKLLRWQKDKNALHLAGFESTSFRSQGLRSSTELQLLHKCYNIVTSRPDAMTYKQQLVKMFRRMSPGIYLIVHRSHQLHF